ncbi:MAG: SAM-dependent methyltransferase [Clostridiaceae bacterium]|nr:SAM-dependent methyltransferase [Clostridiaceae bacterium]
MKKTDLPKLRVFLSGISSRLAENADYFISCTVEFRSGAKTMKAALTCPDGTLLYTFGAERGPVDAAGFADAVMRAAPAYDGLTLTYRERGAVILIEADDRGVRTKRTSGEAGETSAHDAHLLSERDYILRPSQAAPLLRAIGLLTEDGKLRNDKIRKFNQIDAFLTRVRPLIESIDAETVSVLDCACGKSYLSFALNYFIRDVLHRKCFITGVDISEGVIRESRRIADELGYRNMEFLCRDLREYTPEHPSLVLSLHACDTATDMALGLGIRSGAQAIACVPCCHKELLDSFRAPGVDAFTRHGILRSRLCDVLTDGLRVLKLESLGYETSVVEFVSPVDTPKNLLITARKTGGENPRAKKEYDDMCAAMGVFPAIEQYSMCLN